MEVLSMTIGENLHQTLTNLEDVKSDLEKYALNTNDSQAEQMYNQCAQKVDEAAKQLQNRVNNVEQEEPAYKSRPTNQQQTTQ
jgi:predicted ribosome quality control (RQC) complex YloA/Tae2 family protein